MAFKLRSPLNDNEPSKSIPYYSAGNESLNSESGTLQNQRLKKIYQSEDGKGKVFKNNGNFYPTEYFTTNAEGVIQKREGVNFNKSTGLAESSIKPASTNTEATSGGNIMNDSKTSGVTGYRAGGSSGNTYVNKNKKTSKEMGFRVTDPVEKSNSFLSSASIFPKSLDGTKGSVIGQVTGNEIKKEKGSDKRVTVNNSFDVNTSNSGQSSSSSVDKANAFADKLKSLNKSKSKFSTNASSLIPSGGFGTGGKLNTSGRPDFKKTNKILNDATKKATNSSNSSNNSNKKSTNSIKSSGPQDSYKSSVTSTEFFGKDYSGGLKNSSSSTPKFESSVSNARSADYDIIRAKGRGRRSKLKTRLDKREARTANRVDNSLDRIESRQQRSGMKYEKGIQKQLGSQDNFDKGRESVSSKKTNANPPQQTQQSQEKSLDTQKKTKATPRTSGAGNISSGSKAPSLRTPKSNQTVANPSIKLNTSKQTSQTIDDSKIKKSAKQAKGSGRISADTYKNLTGFDSLKTKPGSSSGMTRGKKSNTSIKRNDLSKGPRA